MLPIEIAGLEIDAIHEEAIRRGNMAEAEVKFRIM